MNQSQLSIQTHSFSGRKLKEYPDFIQNLLLVKLATSKANEISQQISAAEKNQIWRAVTLLQKANWDEHFDVDVFQGGGGIAIHMAINEAISAVSRPVTSIDVINRSQSTSDVLMTAMSLTLWQRHKKITEILHVLHNTLKSKSTDWESISLTSRTCMRKASESTLGDLFEGFRLPLLRLINQLEVHGDQFRAVNLGGTAIGRGDGTTAEYRSALQETLNEVYDRVVWRENLSDSVQNVDIWMRYSNELNNMTSHLIKIAKDIRLLSTEEESGFAAIRLPKVIAGSSFYKGKDNPTLPETMMQACFLAKGWHHSMDVAQMHGELQFNTFFPFVGILLMDEISNLTSAIAKFDMFCLRGTVPIKQPRLENADWT